MINIKSGIYKILHKDSGNFYIGSSSNINHRFSQHRSDLNKNRHHSPRLQNTWNKYGKDFFEFSVVEYVENLNLLIEKEQEYLNSLSPVYNVRIIAESNKGIIRKEETKNKISDTLKKMNIVPPSRKGSNWSEGQREKMEKYHKNNKGTLSGKVSAYDTETSSMVIIEKEIFHSNKNRYYGNRDKRIPKL
jgi:hypothetical protein